VETLVLPLANKRAKSLAGIAILKRREQRGKASRESRKAVKKESIKKEVKEEVKDVKIKEEIEEDSDFLKADEVVTYKRKIILNSKYLAN
jgi:hypothetical protein